MIQDVSTSAFGSELGMRLTPSRFCVALGQACLCPFVHCCRALATSGGLCKLCSGAPEPLAHSSLPAHLLGLLSGCGLTRGLPTLLQGDCSASITRAPRCLSSALFPLSLTTQETLSVHLGIPMLLTEPTVPSVVMPAAEIAHT